MANIVAVTCVHETRKFSLMNTPCSLPKNFGNMSAQAMTNQAPKTKVVSRAIQSVLFAGSGFSPRTSFIYIVETSTRNVFSVIAEILVLNKTITSITML
jgi:hypothetical protein